MSDYLHLFETQAAHDAAYNGSEYIEPWVGLITANDTLSYNDPDPYHKIPLTFEITSAGNIIWKGSGKTIQYRINNGEWTNLTATSSGVSFSVNSGDIVQFRGNNNNYSTGTSSSHNRFIGSTAGFKVKGNIMSLCSPTQYPEFVSLKSTYTFYGLFYNCTGLTDASKLILPATTLKNSCYASMFLGCSNLTTAPELPATTLADFCYASIFNGCTNLNYIKCLATNISATNCVYNWVNGVAASGTFIKNASMTSWPTGVNGIPSGWTVQDAS